MVLESPKAESVTPVLRRACCLLNSVKLQRQQSLALPRMMTSRQAAASVMFCWLLPDYHDEAKLVEIAHTLTHCHCERCKTLRLQQQDLFQ